MATSPNRKEIRKTFAGLLSTALVGDGKLVQALYDYLTFDFAGLSPVVIVLSAGSERRHKGLGAPCSDVLAYLYVYVFTVAIEADTSTGQLWTASDSEDKLDDVEAEIADVVRANQSGAYWSSIGYAERSAIYEQEIGGKWYRLEHLTFEFRKLG
jgi:hypothetical protein